MIVDSFFEKISQCPIPKGVFSLNIICELFPVSSSIRLYLQPKFVLIVFEIIDLAVPKLKFCTFSANTNATYDPHGIEFPNAGEYTLSGLSFIGNDYDAHFTASTGDLTLNFSNGTDLTTVENESSGSVYTNDYVDLTVNVEDQDGNDVDNAQAAIYKTSDDTQLMNEDTVSGSATTQFNYPGSAVSIYIRIRKSSVGTRYVPVSTTGTINSTGFTLTAVLREDTIAS